MKTYKDFISSRVIESEPEVVVEQSQKMEFLELEDLPNLLGEASEVNHKSMDPPNILMMRRVSIRQYPNNQRVALYFVDKINKYITIPYTTQQWSSSASIAHMEEVEKNIIEQLNVAMKSENAHKLVFEDSTSMFVGVDTAKQMLKLHESLSNENKKEFVQVAGRSKKDFLQVKDFAKQS